MGERTCKASYSIYLDGVLLMHRLCISPETWSGSAGQLMIKSIVVSVNVVSNKGLRAAGLFQNGECFGDSEVGAMEGFALEVNGGL